MRLRITIGVLAVLGAVAPAASATSFTSPVKLTGATGGEPSIATDPFGDVFVVGPQGIPSGANGGPGIGFWISRDNGSTFGRAKQVGSDSGGGDSDLLYSKGALYVADLEAAAAQICKSTDRGTTFSGIGPTPDPNHCTTTNAGQAGPSDDRQWLTSAPDGTLYLTYHEFVSAQPVAYRSDNAGGDAFANACGSLVTDPTIEANVPTDLTGGTLVAKPVTDKAGNLYVLFSTTTQHENALAAAQGQPSGTFSQLYLAVSHDKCKSFTDYTVFDGEKRYGENTVQFGDIFNDLTIDGAGNLYVIGAGYIGHTAYAGSANVYLFHSSDGGQHWSNFTQIGASNAAHMLPAAAAGPKAGQLTVGYFRTINGVTDPNSSSGKWTYGTAQTSNANASKPEFTYTDVNPGFDYHNGEICNQGTLCGTTPGGPSDRSLLDFTSAALDSHGCPLFTFAGNPTGSAGNNSSSNTFNYVTRQTSGCFAASSSPDGHGHGKPHARRGCPRATGRLRGTTLGQLTLGMTRARAHRAYRRSSYRGRHYQEYFCLSPIGIRVGYASPKLVRRQSRRTQRHLLGRVVWASTSNRFYSLHGIRPRARLAVARKKLHLGRPFHVGVNLWYFGPNGSSTALLKVRHGIVEEIGIATKRLTQGRRAQRTFVNSFY